MLNQASCNGVAQVSLRMFAPPQRELPNVLRVLLDECADTNDRPPPRIVCLIGRWASGQQRLGMDDCSANSGFIGSSRARLLPQAIQTNPLNLQSQDSLGARRLISLGTMRRVQVRWVGRIHRFSITSSARHPLRDGLAALGAMRFDLFHRLGAVHLFATGRTFVKGQIRDCERPASALARDGPSHATNSPASAGRTCLQSDHRIHSARLEETKK